MPSDAVFDSDHTNEILARHLASNDRAFLIIGIWVKLFPIILSSLVAVYSIVTSSIFYDLNLVVNVSIYLLMTSIFVSIASISLMLELNSEVLQELRIYKKITKVDKSSDEYTIQYLYRPIYDNSIGKSIKKTASELLTTAFVILFPGGIADVVLGIASNDPQIGINSTGQVITGIIYLVISAMLLLYTIRVETKSLKKTKTDETERMKRIIEKVQADPLKTEVIRVIFDRNGPTLKSD